MRKIIVRFLEIAYAFLCSVFWGKSLFYGFCLTKNIPLTAFEHGLAAPLSKQWLLSNSHEE